MTSPDPKPGRASELYREFLARLDQVAQTEATVLLTGESGSGKGFAAERIHSHSPRRDGPCVTVNLAAVSPSLIEAELFGHERGAFTGADRVRQGFFRRADGGTLVLDEIALLPLEAQVTLLRVLQERVVEPLGSEKAIPIDVRILATSSADLTARVAEGRVRSDLYYRLAVVPLEVPPLRARLEDLPELVALLSESVSARIGLPPRPISPEALARLADHAWPGNVRELENALERVTVLGAGESRPVEPEEFDFLDESVAGVADELAARALAHGLGVETIEKAMIQAAFAQHRGNLSAAARQIGLTRRAFEYRLPPKDSLS